MSELQRYLSKGGAAYALRRLHDDERTLQNNLLHFGSAPRARRQIERELKVCAQEIQQARDLVGTEAADCLALGDAIAALARDRRAA